ncbi:MAG: hypothetical protein BGO78_08910 [Chloroflexi bacterium 44-23]|nr:MAG: hypothetical protein BGO78_08910 [Chloroflexi bacterium 44-23]
MQEKIVVASGNPVKLAALQNGFQKTFPQSRYAWKTVKAPSGVNAQPSSDAETRQGAFNRVEFIRRMDPGAQFWCGIEGGIEFDQDGRMFAFAWVVIQEKSLCGMARSGAFLLPPQVAKLVRSGLELGEADDLVFEQANSKQKNGAIGLLTGDLITRTSLYQEAVIMALIPFKNHGLYGS